MKINIPLTVPAFNKGEYIDNWRLATKNTGNLMLFAGDQKIEHLNDDFFGPKISADDANPEHLFRIAEKANVGVFAAQLGLIAAYGRDYNKIPYLVKLNSKTDLVPTENQDPYSTALATFEQLIEFKKHSKLKIVGVGYTIYPGSENEAKMLAEAGTIITAAHRQGLLAVLWVYPRGKAVKDEKASHLIAGCAGLAACLGADFVKVNYPKATTKLKNKDIKEIISAAGRTGVVFSGGSTTDAKGFLKLLAEQIELGARGNATGRNIHQRDLDEAVRFADAIAAVSLYQESADKAYQIYTGESKLKKPLNLHVRIK